jgi:ElaB/YqjD/DUF883 family membrane-anchored ribosome-binding protein
MPRTGEYDARILREKATVAKEAVVELAGEVKHYASDRLTQLKSKAGDKLHDANDTVVGFVQENPYKSIVIAAGIGLALGMLLKRR